MVPFLQNRGEEDMMKHVFAAAVAVGLFVSGAAFAADEYNAVPAGDAQYKNCVSYANKRYEGGTEKSPIAGQNKAQAWCTCMWNETPDNFSGGLVAFSESSKGARINKVCEKYADWGN
jgi:hypothetical protein